MPRSSHPGPVDAETLLRAAGVRVTMARCAMIDTLARELTPRTVEYLAGQLACDTVTAYRTLNTFFEVGIVSRTGLGHTHTHYELIAGRAPHGHAVCRSCGLVADIPGVDPATMPEVPGFASITDATLELFGVCRPCAA
jgi:Fe2+ or Zn2+ uptake regulation protein